MAALICHLTLNTAYDPLISLILACQEKWAPPPADDALSWVLVSSNQGTSMIGGVGLKALLKSLLGA